MRISDWSSDVCSSDLGDLDRCERGVELVLVELLGRRAVSLAALHVILVSVGEVVVYGPAWPCHVELGSGVDQTGGSGSVGRDAPRAGGAFDVLHRGCDLGGVQVGLLGMCALTTRVFVYLAHLL